jgi:hypothetical protein
LVNAGKANGIDMPVMLRKGYGTIGKVKKLKPDCFLSNAMIVRVRTLVKHVHATVE